MKRWIKIWAIVRVSMLETLGRPIALLLTFSSAIWILVLPLLQFQRFSEDGRMARDCGLATAFVFGLIFVIGNASRLAVSLTNGTAAAVWVKPVSRLFWLIGYLLGGLLATALFMVVQVGVIVLAEAFSPTYHLDGQYANVPALFVAMAMLLIPMILGALNQRLRGGRFVLCSFLLMPIVVLLKVLWEGAPHLLGISSCAFVLFMALIQVATIAMAFATRCSMGLTTLLSIGFVMIWGLFLNGSAYFPLDALSMGGMVSFQTVLLLIPQTVAIVAFALWVAVGLLRHRSVV